MTFTMRSSPGYLVNHLGRLFAAELQARIRPLGLSVGVFPLMLQLWERDGLTQRELVDRLGLEQATVANTLSRMARDGLIVRRGDPHDGRIARSWLTERGRALRAPAVAAAEEVNAAALSGLSERERDAFVQLMQKTIAQFEGNAAG
ncbi:Transcriptional regulator HosA [Roseivivax jejudonensis]|uniref:Transcriptional regulator HosA n=1 Tax=Roseivivax jejudonensis TaxID=1529041 RepID=A0A1X6YAQ8_9RHOB|nr:MarR family transcriptional regulator [Roseivivax jejudonensis]SLN15676.1 Transcriptional regulator HosA [Roseivivax jejudonensis]